ncbi:hypothetical protein B0H16DRAFT_1686645 [Mycena metata]|uniref:Uncharacterized protein n=1 Tax=Mycena metata TaxID=1033252 RepID=A0AAD7JLV4_9AGAR|nr:hypothetical protein B0H16DRAFT_1686645 [Mycena metata]
MNLTPKSFESKGKTEIRGALSNTASMTGRTQKTGCRDAAMLTPESIKKKVMRHWRHRYAIAGGQPNWTQSVAICDVAWGPAVSCLAPTRREHLVGISWPLAAGSNILDRWWCTTKGAGWWAAANPAAESSWRPDSYQVQTPAAPDVCAVAAPSAHDVTALWWCSSVSSPALPSFLGRPDPAPYRASAYTFVKTASCIDRALIILFPPVQYRACAHPSLSMSTRSKLHPHPTSPSPLRVPIEPWYTGRGPNAEQPVRMSMGAAVVRYGARRFHRRPLTRPPTSPLSLTNHSAAHAGVQEGDVCRGWMGSLTARRRLVTGGGAGEGGLVAGRKGGRAGVRYISTTYNTALMRLPEEGVEACLTEALRIRVSQYWYESCKCPRRAKQRGQSELEDENVELDASADEERDVRDSKSRNGRTKKRQIASAARMRRWRNEKLVMTIYIFARGRHWQIGLTAASWRHPKKAREKRKVARAERKLHEIIYVQSERHSSKPKFSRSIRANSTCFGPNVP